MFFELFWLCWSGRPDFCLGFSCCWLPTLFLGWSRTSRKTSEKRMVGYSRWFMFILSSPKMKKCTNNNNNSLLLSLVVVVCQQPAVTACGGGGWGRGEGEGCSTIYGMVLSNGLSAEGWEWNFFYLPVFVHLGMGPSTHPLQERCNKDVFLLQIFVNTNFYF